MNKIEQAELLARFVHFGQKRQDGEDYIEHCKRIAERVDCAVTRKVTGCFVEGYDTNLKIRNPKEVHDDMVCAAWLHDCIEDFSNPHIIKNLIKESFGEKIYDLVELLTHHPSLSYNEYITVVARYPQALQIKWIDMIDNTSYAIPEKQWNKYRDACLFLQKKGIDIPSILKERLKICLVYPTLTHEISNAVEHDFYV